MHCRLDVEDLKEAFGRLLPVYQDATLDFIQLQSIDYVKSLSCPHGWRRITCDGIALGYRLDQSRQAQPWAADLSSQPVVGSLFKERLLLQSRSARGLLLQFAADGSGTAGLCQKEYDDMLRLLREAAATGIVDASAQVLPYLAR
jgi:hypothetical protein